MNGTEKERSERNHGQKNGCYKKQALGGEPGPERKWVKRNNELVFDILSLMY